MSKDQDDLRCLLLDLVTNIGIDQTRKFVATYGVINISELPTCHYVDFWERGMRLLSKSFEAEGPYLYTGTAPFGTPQGTCQCPMNHVDNDFKMIHTPGCPGLAALAAERKEFEV